MPSDQNLHLSPITGKMVHLAQAVSAAPTQRHQPKPEDESRFSHQRSEPTVSPPSRYSNFAPQFKVMNPVLQQFNGCTFNISNAHSSRSSYPSSRHQSSVPRSTEPRQQHRSSRATTSTSMASIPVTTNGTMVAYNPPRHSHLSREKAIHFTESVSAREKEKKHWDPASGHLTNHVSKSGNRTEAKKVERLTCESCQVRSQAWLERGSGKRLCDGCYRFREGKRAGKK